MKIYKVLFIVLIAAATSSCGAFKGGTGVTKTTTETFDATEASKVEIYVSTKPTKDYIEIGTVSVLRVKSPMFPVNRPAEDIQSDMKEQAASIGGQAIIDYRESGEANMTGTVIRFKE